METQTLTAHDRELYLNVVQTYVTPIPIKAPYDFAPQIVDWLYLNMPEELDGGPIDLHAIDVALVHLGWVEP